MILVLNMNASVDKKYVLDKLPNDTAVRAASVQNTPGGKGIHAANIMTILGENCVVTGFVGGYNGDFIVESLKKYGIKSDFVRLPSGETRCCLAFMTADGAQSEVLEPGPSVPVASLQEFYDKFDMYLDKVTAVAASGSVPQNVPTDVYAKLIAMARAKDKKFFLDTSGVLLQEAIKAKPYFIKPNRDEVEAITGRKMETKKDVIQEIKQFMQQGIKIPVISLGADGVFAGYEGKIYKVTVMKIKAVNAVGSGDSFVGGMVTACERGLSIEESLKLASACGTANAMEDEIAVVKTDVVADLVKKIIVEIVA
ncbi:MAG: 1-phosphofructokinase family hexose kinase [Selenomonadaceae bacterium]